MAELVASSAYGPIVLVALEQTLPAEQRIIDDTLAYKMLPPYMKMMVNICHVNAIRQIFFKLMDSSMPGLRAGFPSRKRYINDKMLALLDSGIESLVVLGAGLDTLAYRMSQLSNLSIYEVDLPENIAYKEKKLSEIFGAVPSYVTLMPINFEKQKLDEVLLEHGYSFEEKTVFIWEAVAQYLTESAVRETFDVLANAKSGSHLIFTYVYKDFIDGENLYGLESLYQRFIVNDKIWHFGIAPDNVSHFLAEYGWKELEQAGSDEFVEQYLKPIGRTESIAEIERIVYAEKL